MIGLFLNFLEELRTRGRIYGYRFCPRGHIKTKPIHDDKGKCVAGKAVQVMIDNNLDFNVAYNTQNPNSDQITIPHPSE
ncbi:hypothetical protein [Desulfobacter hydrogenophilus]|uniref:hypothetical protein n=1 Tax=Desulfobacter hydrogenophilus TaxID=2291 RepID=UPI001A94F26B|nr:hypothetical protein [Desulfobacter hydrogenophilus]